MTFYEKVHAVSINEAEEQKLKYKDNAHKVNDMHMYEKVRKKENRICFWCACRGHIMQACFVYKSGQPPHIYGNKPWRVRMRYIEKPNNSFSDDKLQRSEKPDIYIPPPFLDNSKFKSTDDQYNNFKDDFKYFYGNYKHFKPIVFEKYKIFVDELRSLLEHEVSKLHKSTNVKLDKPNIEPPPRKFVYRSRVFINSKYKYKNAWNKDVLSNEYANESVENKDVVSKKDKSVSHTLHVESENSERELEVMSAPSLNNKHTVVVRDKDTELKLVNSKATLSEKILYTAAYENSERNNSTSVEHHVNPEKVNLRIAKNTNSRQSKDILNDETCKHDEQSVSCVSKVFFTNSHDETCIVKHADMSKDKNIECSSTSMSSEQSNEHTYKDFEVMEKSRSSTHSKVHKKNKLPFVSKEINENHEHSSEFFVSSPEDCNVNKTPDNDFEDHISITDDDIRRVPSKESNFGDKKLISIKSNEYKKFPLSPLYKKVHVEIDDLRETKRDESKYVVIFLEHATQYVEVIPVENLESETVVAACKDFAEWRKPKILCVKEHAIFANEKFYKFAKEREIKISYPNPLHFTDNALIDRSFARILSVLEACIKGKILDYEEYLQRIVLTINDEKDKETGFSPNFLMHGKDTCMSNDIDLEKNRIGGLNCHRVSFLPMQKRNSRVGSSKILPPPPYYDDKVPGVRRNQYEEPGTSQKSRSAAPTARDFVVDEESDEENDEESERDITDSDESDGGPSAATSAVIRTNSRRKRRNFPENTDVFMKGKRRPTPTTATKSRKENTQTVSHTHNFF